MKNGTKMMKVAAMWLISESWHHIILNSAKQKKHFWKLRIWDWKTSLDMI